MRQARVVIVIAFLILGIAFGSDKKIASPLGTRPGDNSIQGILIDGTLYISGQGDEDATGKIPGDFDTEGRQCLDNIGAVLKAAGIAPPDVVSVPVSQSATADEDYSSRLPAGGAWKHRNPCDRQEVAEMEDGVAAVILLFESHFII